MINLFIEGFILFDDFGMVIRKIYYRSKGVVKVISCNVREVINFVLICLNICGILLYYICGFWCIFIIC